jgi:hypothetical protein
MSRDCSAPLIIATPRQLRRLLPLLCDELRKVVAQKMADEASGPTLQPTALIREAWLGLSGLHSATDGQPKSPVNWLDATDSPVLHSPSPTRSPAQSFIG